MEIGSLSNSINSYGSNPPTLATAGAALVNSMLLMDDSSGDVIESNIAQSNVAQLGTSQTFTTAQNFAPVTNVIPLTITGPAGTSAAAAATALYVNGGLGGTGSGSGNGTAGGGMFILLGNGGTGGSSGTGGAGGSMAITLGSGGTGGSGAGSPGTFAVSGGINTLTSSASQATTINGTQPGNVTSGSGISANSVFVVQGPQGGPTSFNGGTGGAGGGVSITAGLGGGATGSSGIGGQGGPINISAGNGASVGSGVINGNGGNIVLTAGSAGTGGTGGSAGFIQAASNLQVPDGTTSSAAIQFLSSGANTGFIGNGAGSFEALISGTQTHNFLSSGLLSGSGEELGWSSSSTPSSTFDAGLSRATTGVVSVDTSGRGNGQGMILSSNTAKVLGQNYTNNTTSPTTIVGNIGNGLSWTLPASTNWSFNCNLVYESANPTSTLPKLVLYFAYSSAPTSFIATAEIYTNNTTTTSLVTTGTVTSGSSPVLVLTGGQPNASGQNYIAIIYGGVEMNGAGTISIQAAESGGTSSPSITILRGSYCQLF